MTADVRHKERLYTKSGTEAPWYSGWSLSDEERERFRQSSLQSQSAKARALSGECDLPKLPIIEARLDPLSLMEQLAPNGLSALSLFSGGGGLDIGFERAGYEHVASYDVLTHAGEVLRAARPNWKICDGLAGDVTAIDWRSYRGKVDVLHGGPPCQPFSHAGRQRGASDVRDMVPELVRAVLQVRPKAFVCENVAGLTAKKFEEYLRTTLFEPLGPHYEVRQFALEAADFGVPQRRRRVFFVGFAQNRAAAAFNIPRPTHAGEKGAGDLPKTMGAREALGLPAIGKDGLAPTIRSGLTGPRHTTSVNNSSTSARQWAELEIWPNGVAATKEAASQFPAKSGHYRMSIADCMVLQGFPAEWPLRGAVYKSLGLIGNSVAPPMGYAVAKAVAAAIKAR